MRMIREINFETELNDGTYLTTTNDPDVTFEVPGERIIQRWVSTPMEELLWIHEQFVAETRSKRPQVTPTRIRTLEDALEVAHRLHCMRSTHRQVNGFLTVEHMRKRLGRMLTADEMAIVTEIENLESIEEAPPSSESA